jgi:hypothetical protein
VASGASDQGVLGVFAPFHGVSNENIGGDGRLRRYEISHYLSAASFDTGEKFPREFSKKFKMAPTEYLGAGGTLIHEKNLKSKILCQTPFKNS